QVRPEKYTHSCGLKSDIEALDLEHPVLDAGMDTITASNLDLRTNVSDGQPRVDAKRADEGVGGPLGIAASSGKAMIVADGLGLRLAEEDSGSNNAVVAGGLSENLGAEGGDEDGSVGAGALPDVESDPSLLGGRSRRSGWLPNGVSRRRGK
ncbi:hypothetical protein H0H81_002370, partial [Sphagnurus paluster]